MENVMKIRVKGSGQTPTRIQLISGRHKIIIDEPEQMGGSDMGPTPVQVLLFALAGCLYVTGNFVAKQMGLPLEKLEIELEGTIDISKFMGLDENTRAGFSSVIVNLVPHFSLPVPEEKVSEWIAGTGRRCPVTDNIKEATSILNNMPAGQLN